MKIVQFRAENFKRLKVVEITPKGNVVKITGANDNGKSSVLDAIFVALGGAAAMPKEPIRQGETKAVVRLDLGDILVERTFAGGKSSLVVSSKTGAKFPSPQKMLDELVGRLAFDPLEFLSMDPKKQAETLRAVVGLDFSKIDAHRQTAYEQRTVLNRDLKALETQHLTIDVPPNTPDSEVDPAQLLTQLNEARSTNTRNKSIREEARSCASYYAKAKEATEDLRARLNAAEMEQAEFKAKMEATQRAADEVLDVDVVPIEAKFNTISTTNQAVRQKAKKAELSTSIDAKKAEVATLEERIAKADVAKTEKLQAAKFPVEGLGFSDAGDLTFNGIPFEQTSHANKLKVSCAMAMSMNPKLRILRVMNGNLLDTASMQMLTEMATAADYQVWMERVDESGLVGVVMEDGEVVADNQVGAGAAS